VNEEEDALIERAEAAAILGVHPITVTRQARDGKIPHELTPGGHRRYRRSVIQAMADEAKVENTK
jgi:excisionase family DNA binding protein